MRDHKTGVQKALDGFFKRQSALKRKAAAPREKRNASPEKTLVEKPCVAWMQGRGWIGQVYESKAKFINGRWQKGGMKYGHSDWAGMTAEAIAAFVEFKAPGKRASFWRAGNEKQQDFILEKINGGAFAVVVDSADLLERTFIEWHTLKNKDRDAAKQYLLDALPSRPNKKEAGGITTDLF